MQEVVIKVGTHARLDYQMNLFAGSIAPHRIGVARFLGAKDRYQALLYPIFERNLPSVVLFRQFWAADILQWPLGRCRAAVSCPFHLSGHIFGEVFELLDEHSTTTEITLHSCRLKQKPQRASKSHPIKSGNNPCDVLSKFAKKSLRNSVGCLR